MNDKNMPIRMLRYAILIENRYKKFPIQAVLYVGDKKLNIKNEIKFNNLQYSYKVYDIKEIDCNKLINSSSMEDNVLSILCRIDNEDKLIKKIIEKLLKIEEKKRKDYIKRLLILARLRPKMYNKLKLKIKEANMPIVFDPKTDPVYKEGMEYGLQLGVQQGVKKAKLEAAKTFIKEFNLPIEAISKKLDIPLEEIREYLNKSNDHIKRI